MSLEGQISQLAERVGQEFGNYQPKVTTDGSLYIDPDTGEFRQNITDFDIDTIWNTGDSQIFQMPAGLTKVKNIYVNGPRLSPSQYQLLSGDRVEILDELEDGDRINIDVEHFVVIPA